MEDFNTLQGQSQKQLQDIFLKAPMAICSLRGTSHIIQVVNERMLEIWGRRAEEVLHRPIFEALPEATGQGFESILDSVYETGERFSVNEMPVVLNRNGERQIVFIKFVCEPFREEDGTVSGITAVADDITEQVHDRLRVSDSETRYKQLVESLPVAIYTCDKKGRITFFNEIATQLWGYVPPLNSDEVKYCACHKVWMADGSFVPADQTPMAIALQTGQSFHNVEALIEQPGGEKLYLIVNVHPIFDNKGNVRGAINIFQDISSRKKTEVALSESERKYRHLLQALPAAVYTTDINGYITLYNKAATDLWGRSPEIGKDKWCGSWKIYKADGITRMPLEDCPIALLLKTGENPVAEEMIIERPDGTRRSIVPHPEPMYDIAGNMTGAVNMLLDITEKKDTEKHAAHLAAIVESSTDAIMSKTLDSVITSWNDAAERMFGYTAAEMTGQKMLLIIPDDRMSEEPRILERIRRGERIEPYETRRITKHGQLLDVAVTVSPIRDSSGRVTGASTIARDITRQKETERRIRENEERLRMASESTHLGTWEYHPLEGTVLWSAECKKIYGLSEGAEPDVHMVRHCHHEEDREAATREVEKAMAPDSDGNFHVQYRIVRANDQQVRWVNVQGKVFFNSDNQPDRLIGTMLDITDEKSRQQELIDSVELFRTMADNVPAMIWMSGSDKFNDYFNRTWLDFTGRTLEQESGEGWLAGVHPDDVEKCVNIYTASLSAQTGFYTEYRLRRYDGKYRWVADNSVPRFSPSGNFLGFISACIDIDDQKRFREKIQASELLFKTISNAAPVGLWMTDTQAQNTFVNDTWVEWTGVPAEKQLGVGWLDKVLEEDKIDAPSRFREALKNEEKYSTEFRIIRQDGELRWCLTEGFPYYNMYGELEGYAGSVTDITDLKKMEERKDDFIKMASHELKTPITSINGYIQLLLNIYNETTDEKIQASKEVIRSSLGTIAKQVSKLTRLIAELLDLSKIESGQLELHTTTFSLKELIEEAVQEARYITSRHAIICHTDYEGKITADRDRISQVMTNLLNNAIKYSPGADKVEVWVEGDSASVAIHIKDYGIGIDKKDQQRIFERFYRIEGRNEQTYPGFGIGLFITNEIVQRHRGAIHVKSEKDEGAVFTVILPVAPQNTFQSNGKKAKKNISS